MPDDDDDPIDADEPAPDSDEEPSDEPDVPVEGDDPQAPPLDAAVVRRFLSTRQARSIAENAIRKLVPRDQVEDLATDALVRALRAPPPRTEIVLPGWLAPIAVRTAIRWLEKRKRRSKYEGPMPTRDAREDDYTGEPIDDEDAADAAHEPDDDTEPAELLGTHLDRLIGDHARDQEVRAFIKESSEGGKTYAEIAAARGLTEAQVVNRIKRFKKKYAARVKRRRQLMVVLWALGAGLVAAIAIALAWWLLHRVPDDIGPDPSPPAPSASAPGPEFLNSQPPAPAPDRKPAPLKP
jgi:DNA-directed RNA polymerase specialized sigma24 family protein